MSATEELRTMLDERGESYVENDFGITWRYYSDPHTATESMDGTLIVTGFTPEQAIAATLGAGTCKDVCAGVSEFTCSKCGFNCDLTSWISLFDGDEGKHRHHHHGTPNYCPNCGKRVVEVDE